jgi:endonuclease/exonuclease/phosphatase family metal-dependent hydrolase
MNIFTLNAANYDDHKGWTARLPFIVDTIIQTNADVIGFSEIRYDAANPFNQYAAQYWESIPAPGPTNSTPSMGDQILALLTAKSGSNSWTMVFDVGAKYSAQNWEGLSIISRFPIAAHGSFQIASGGTDGNSRVTQWADITLVNGSNLRLLNTHFSTDEPSAATDAQQVAAAIAPYLSGFAAMTGDLNVEPNDPALANLTGLVDLWPNLNGSAPGYTFPSAALMKRIDYIWVSPSLGRTATAIWRAPMDLDDVYAQAMGATVYASDHVGVVASFDL